jgi:hypothetical protein
MKILQLAQNLFILALILFFNACSSTQGIKQSKGWIRLFDGKTFNGWKLGENPGTFSIEDGSIKVAGPRSHIYSMALLLITNSQILNSRHRS